MESKINYNSICDNKLKEQTIQEFQRAILEGLIDKYGIENMLKVQRGIDFQGDIIEK